MYAVTSPYARKDGSQRRSYLCKNVHLSTNLCDQPNIDAERIDSAVVAHLDRIFIDFDRWAAALARGRADRRAGIEAELARARKGLEQAVRRESKLAERLLDALGEDEERQYSELHGRVLRDRDDARAAIDRLEAALDAEYEDPPHDALLDVYNGLARAVRGDRDGGDMGDLNERLRANFECFRLSEVDDGVVGVLPILREDVVKRHAPDLGAAYREWEAAGEPDPTPDEIEEYERLCSQEEPTMIDGGRVVRAPADLPARSPALLWVRGHHAIRPPARAFKVLAKTGRGGQEPWHSELSPTGLEKHSNAS